MWRLVNCCDAVEKDCDGGGGKLGGMVAAKNNEMRREINRSVRNLQ